MEALSHRGGDSLSPLAGDEPSPPQYPWCGETIAKATTARQAITMDPCLGRILPPCSCPQTICQRLEAFANLLPDLSLNANGLIPFTGLGVDDSGVARDNVEMVRDIPPQAVKLASPPSNRRPRS
jgi:hypothetical protein